MTPERLRQVEALYHQAKELPAADRRSLLEQADSELRREVESLLANAAGTTVPIPALVTPGAQLGPYKIGDQIGAGGMGQVFRVVDTV